MAERSIIVTAADAAFFDYLRDLIESIAAVRADDGTEIAVFDLGLAEDQRAWLAPRVAQLIVPDWDLQVPERLRAKPHLRAHTLRPFLPRYFPGHDILIWIDADIWLQDWRAVGLYREGARLSGFAVTPQTDRSYIIGADLIGYRRRRYMLAYGEQLADAIARSQELNAGAFAGRPDSPVWGDWAARKQEAIDRLDGAFVSDQIALNAAIHGRRLPLQMLPALCNWQCHQAVPMWDEERRIFCEPFLPFAPISLLHLTHGSKERGYRVMTRRGGRREMTLRYPRAQEQETAG